MQRLANTIRSFAAEKSGQVAIILGLSLVPSILAIGCGVDLSRAVVVRQRLGEARDAAGLAVGGTVCLSDLAMTDLAHKYFYANYPDAELGTVTSLSVTKSGEDDNVINVAGAAEVATAFMSLIGIGYMDVSVEIEVTREAKGLEIALALDNTGSMSGSKSEALKSATTTLVNILCGQETVNEKLKMSLVPFSQTVKVDTTTFLNNGWMDINGPDSSAYSGYTTYTSDGTTGNQETRLKRSAKYAGKALNNPNNDCNMQKILPLTSNKITLLSYANGMAATGYTDVAIGAGWG